MFPTKDENWHHITSAVKPLKIWKHVPTHFPPYAHTPFFDNKGDVSYLDAESQETMHALAVDMPTECRSTRHDVQEHLV